jgi:hypothetical protein
MRTKWMEQVALMGDMINAYNWPILFSRPEVKKPL